MATLNVYAYTPGKPIKPKKVAEIDLCQLWEQTAPTATEAAPTVLDSEVCPV